MDLNTRVQNVKSDSMMSYWKGALNDFRVNQQDMVKVRTQAMELAKEFDKLLRLYEKQDLANVGLRETLKQVRREKEMKEKQVQLANRTIERLSVKQGMTEAQDAVKDAHIRRLETKVAAMRSSGELKAMCDDLEVSVEKLEQRLKVQEEQVEDAERRARDAEKENELLQRGIQIAADQLTKSQSRDTDDVSPSLLMAVAKGQNDAVLLSKELADARNTISDMQKALVSAKKHLNSQQDALMRWKEFEASQLKEKKMMQQDLESTQNQLQKALEEAKNGDAKYVDMKKKLTEMTSAYEIEKTRREAVEMKMESLLATTRETVVKATPTKPTGSSPVHKSVEQLCRSFESAQKQEPRRNKVVAIEAHTTSPPRTLFDLANMDIEFST